MPDQSANYATIRFPYLPANISTDWAAYRFTVNATIVSAEFAPNNAANGSTHITTIISADVSTEWSTVKPAIIAANRCS
jgi:hypothetical protein